MTLPFNELDTVDRLTRAEHLLVWAMRAIALGHEDCLTVVRTFRSMCGARGDRLLQTYTVFIKYLAMAAPRRQQVHVPGCLCVGQDEAAVLRIIAAGQASLADGSEMGLRRAIGELTGPRTDEALIFAVQSAAGLLKACGLTLPDRMGDTDALGVETAVMAAPLFH